MHSLQLKLLDKNTREMGCVRLLALTTLDGYISNKEGLREWGLNRDAYGITDLYEGADFIISPEMSASDITSICDSREGYCLLEVTPKSVSMLKDLFKHKVINEIILYVFGYMSGSGIRLFSEDISVSSNWELKECKSYNKEILRLHYVRTS